MYLDQPLRHFLDKLASRSPEPGGGSAAALAGAVGAALVSMVANFTLGKENYKDVQPRITALLDESEKLRAALQDLLQKDTEAYGALSEAYRLPKQSEAEKAARTARIQETLRQATRVPLEIGIASLAVTRLAKEAADIGNVNVITDAGVAALLARACARAAALNVKINIKSMKDETFNASLWSRMQEILVQMDEIEREVLEITYKKI